MSTQVSVDQDASMPSAWPKISIIVAVLGSAATLQRCIDGFISQSYGAKELIVIDGGSNDGSVEILAANQEHLTYWVSEPDRGIYHAWNKGLKRATGEWVCFIGADDYFWHPDVLTRMIPELLFALAENRRIVYGQVAYVGRTGTPLFVEGIPWARVRDRLQHLMSFTHSGSFCHRTVFQDHGWFDEAFKIAGDYEFALRELKDREAHYVPGVIIIGMQFGGASRSLNNRLLTAREYCRARAMHGLNCFSWRLNLWYMQIFVERGLRTLLGEQVMRHLADGYRIITGRKAIWTK